MSPSPSRYFYPFIAFLIGGFIAGPGFGLAGAMALWYLLTYTAQVFQRWPAVLHLKPVILGFWLTLLVLALEFGFIMLVGWSMQMSTNI